jgi:hypothetical protein
MEAGVLKVGGQDGRLDLAQPGGLEQLRQVALANTH